VRGRSGRVAALSLLGTAAAYLVVPEPRLARSARALAERMWRPRGDRFDRVVSTATDIGSMYAVGGASAVLALSGRRAAAIDVAAAGSAGWTLAQILNALVRRPRPYEDGSAARLVAVPAGTGWPSGHPAVVAAVAAALGPRLPASARRLAWAAAGLVGVSRVYVGVHYPADVAGGLAVGAVAGAAWHWLRSGGSAAPAVEPASQPTIGSDLPTSDRARLTSASETSRSA
jgi:membrane-associated phospholipid phosphatase